MPWAERGPARENLVRDLRAITGSSIAQVSYLAPPAVTATQPVCDEFDDVDVGIELKTETGETFAAVWQMEGYNEGLSFGPGTGESRHGRYALTRSNVTESPRWRSLLGRPVTHVGAGWQIPNEGCPEAVWSVRLVFEGAYEVLLALGRSLADCRIEYQPDEVLVIWDKARAEAYRIPAQTTSAYDP
jgi:hypothetical protein